ncbi:hypothetical protein CVT24_005360 [Panaeolus cyanescens]|uniref:F-box domain-containing protein n=1 Tax=Panaeolus cyanescens TaxID=181874 RepID=A0A409Y8Y6_9AGAR|nr:hypothetical protein CVT24_005360 [Panaeolus cyanescens]
MDFQESSPTRTTTISSQPVSSAHQFQPTSESVQPSPSAPPNHATDDPALAMLAAANPESLPAPLWKTADPSHIPLPTYSPGYKYVQFARTYTNKTISPWIPHPLSPQERIFYLSQTRHLLARISYLEDRRGLKDPKLEEELTITRIQYSVSFGRVFRINDLPTEILTSILRLACWSSRSPDEHSLWRLWLSGTCTRFRSVMIRDPTLWSAFVYNGPSQHHQALTYLERAGNLPLDIRIGERPKRPLRIHDVIPLFDELWKKISQLRTLIVVLQDWDPIMHIVNFLGGIRAEHLPLMLEHVELHRTGPYYVQSGGAFPEDNYEHPPPLFGGLPVPSLRIIVLDAIHTDWQRALSWNNLTTLDIRKLPFTRTPNNRQFQSLLRANPGLKKLLLDGAGPMWPAKPNNGEVGEPVVLPELEQLVLGDFSLHYGIHLLSLFRAPNVTDLTLLNTCGNDEAGFFDVLCEFSSNVRVLTLFKSEAPMTENITLAVLKWLNTMKHLGYLRICEVHESVLDLFHYNPVTLSPYTTSEATDGVICPKLSFFEMQRAPAEAIAKFAETRKAFGAPLQKILVPVWMRHAISDSQSRELTKALNPHGKLLVLFGKSEEEAQLRKALVQQ